MKHLESLQRNKRIQRQRRTIDRRHRCVKCGEVYYCEPCSEAMTASTQRTRDNAVTLYRGTQQHCPFVCGDCRRRRRR